jgi:hypothetical protein
MSAPNELLLSVTFIGVAVYFTAQIARSLVLLVRYWRQKTKGLVTWPLPAQPFRAFLWWLGILSAGLTLLSLLQQGPLHRTFSQAVTAVYFLAVFPALRTIRLGLYEQGLWFRDGFLPYSRIARWSFRETPEIVLLLVPRGGNRGLRLRVPPGEYGAVRKVLQQKSQERVIQPDAGILGLSS